MTSDQLCGFMEIRNETHIQVFFKFSRRYWDEELSREKSEHTDPCLFRSAPSLDRRYGDVKGDMDVLLAVPEPSPEGVKGPSRLSALILFKEDMGSASGEATIGVGEQHASAFFFDLRPGLASKGIPRILPGVCGCISKSFCFPSCSGDEYGGNVADRLGAGSLGMSSWIVWTRALNGCQCMVKRKSFHDLQCIDTEIEVYEMNVTFDLC